jgi:serine/threonine protein kinase/tetratricopeptide (TPR) repeat protein
MPSDPKRVQAVFLAAVDQPAVERYAVLDRECGADADLRHRVEALLRAHDQPGSYLNEPVVDLAVTVDPTLGAASEDSNPEPSISIESVGSHIGPYKLLQNLGEGGMGSVWVAEQTEPVKRRVALKIIKPGMDSTTVLRRFEAERQALALMDHTHIAKVFDAGTTAHGRPYFVMELIKGVPITRYCDELHLPIRERLALFVPVCQAIQHAHQKGVIHRDIKPSNVLVCIQDGKPVPKVIDFGVAKALHQKLADQSIYTEIGQIIGTLEYMSPEQAELSPLDIDTRADVYALGVLLYELLTGTTPLDRKRLKSAAVQEMLRVIREVEPPKPSTRLTDSKEALPNLAAQRRTEPGRLTKEVRGELDWIVMKCLEKDRGRRYESADGLSRDVERYLTDEPVEACPPSAGYRLRKFLRRYKKPVLAVTTVFLVLMAGVVVSTWQAIRASRAEAEARRERDTAQAVRDFLQNDLLRQADAGVQVEHLRGASGINFEVHDNPTIKELLDRAAAGLTAERIDQKFPNKPLVQAEILYTVGSSYGGVEEHEKAISHLKRAAELRQIHLGPDHLDTLAVLSSLADEYIQVGKKAEALSLYEKVKNSRESRLGPDHPALLAERANLAWAYWSIGKKEEGLAQLEKVRESMTASLGADHLITLKNLALQAGAYYELGRTAEAVALFEQVRDGIVPKLTLDHPYTLLILRNLACAYYNAGRKDESIIVAEQMLPRARRVLGEWHSITIAALADLITCLEETNQFTKVCDVWAELVSIVRKRNAYDDPNLAFNLAQYGIALLKAGKSKEAEQVFRECLSIFEKKQPDDWMTFDAKSSLGGSLLDQKKYTEAEPLLLNGYEGMKKREEKIPAGRYGWDRLLESLERLARFYEVTGKPEEAAKWRKELEEAKTLGKRSPKK